MKNYPNQAASFERVRGTLSTIREMYSAGENVTDDGVLGYELARRGFYTFRGFDYANGTTAALEARISTEKSKKASNQGARTNARELRRTLIDLGWIVDDGAMTPAGELLLASDPGSDEERDLLRTGLLELEVPDDDGIEYSHPIVILLRLLHRHSTVHRAGLELILEAKDDSEAELERVLLLYDMIRDDSPADRAAVLGVSETVRANSVKVLPTLAKYAGLVTEDLSSTWHITEDGLAALGESNVPDDETVAVYPPQVSPPAPAPKSETTNAKRRRRLTRGKEKNPADIGTHAVNKTVPKGLTPDQQAEAQQRLQERTVNHQALVNYFASLIDGGAFYEDNTSYDFVWLNDYVDHDNLHLFEMKTIDADADAQITRAVGQLLYYGHFNVVAKFKEYPLTRTVVVDADVHPDLADFLDTLGIGAIKAQQGKGLIALNEVGATTLAMLPLKPAAG